MSANIKEENRLTGLALARRTSESIVLKIRQGNENICVEVSVIEITSNQARLLFSAGNEVEIARSELLDPDELEEIRKDIAQSKRKLPKKGRTKAGSQI